VQPGRERDARFDGDDALIVGNDGRGLLRDWDPQARDLTDLAIGTHFSAIIGRLTQQGWLDVEKVGGNDLRITLGPRATADGNA